MVVKINKKPIVVDETTEGDGIDWVYMGVSVTGYLFIFWIVDYVVSTFFFYHPFPFISTVADIIVKIVNFLTF